MDFSFAENTAVKEIEKVPEQFRPLYVRDDVAGVFKLKADDPVVKGSIEAVVKLDRALKAERAVTKDLKTKVVDLSPLSDYGADPEAIAKTIQAKIEELQGKKVDVEKIKTDISKGFQSEITKRDGRLKSLQDQLENVLVTNAIRQSLGDKAVNPDLVIPFAKERVRVVDENGKLVVRVVDATGDVRHTASGLMGIDELITEMRGNPQYAVLFKSQAPSGSGAPSGASAGRPRQPDDKLTPLQKINRGLANRRI